jgi:hypothetical protein
MKITFSKVKTFNIIYKILSLLIVNLNEVFILNEFK